MVKRLIFCLLPGAYGHFNHLGGGVTNFEGGINLFITEILLHFVSHNLKSCPQNISV